MSAHLRAVERACDLAWLHLLDAGLVGADFEHDLVTATLRTVLQEARDAEVVRYGRPGRRWAA